MIVGDTITYLPNADTNGTDSAVFTLTDGISNRDISVAISGINTIDAIADRFSLSPQSGVATGTVIVSNEITVSGLSPNISVPAVLTGDITSKISVNGVWQPI